MVKKKATRKKTAKKPTRKKPTTKRRTTTRAKKPALCRKIEDMNAVADKALHSAEEMKKKADKAKDRRLKATYNRGFTQMLTVAKKARAKAVQLMASKVK